MSQQRQITGRTLFSNFGEAAITQVTIQPIQYDKIIIDISELSKDHFKYICQHNGCGNYVNIEDSMYCSNHCKHIKTYEGFKCVKCSRTGDTLVQMKCLFCTCFICSTCANIAPGRCDQCLVNYKIQQNKLAAVNIYTLYKILKDLSPETIVREQYESIELFSYIQSHIYKFSDGLNYIRAIKMAVKTRSTTHITENNFINFNQYIRAAQDLLESHNRIFGLITDEERKKNLADIHSHAFKQYLIKAMNELRKIGVDVDTRNMEFYLTV